MIKQNKLKYLSAIIGCFLLVFTSCETTELDVNINPNALSPDSADPTLVLNGIQISFTGQALSLHNNVRDVMRHVNMFGTYAANSPSSALNGAWSSTYQIANNTKLLEQLNESSELANHVGAAQVLEVYAYANLVDFIGTAVFTEAIDPAISNPAFDNGADIYAALYDMLDEAVANLNTTGQLGFEDMYFNGDLTKWVKLANTLKVRLHVQSKLAPSANAASDINSIVGSGRYINSPADDFQARFGTSITNPDTRHPDFVATYVTGAGGIYMSNELMNILLNDKSVVDPRLNYYVYRQSLADPVNTPSNNILPCEGNPAYTLCYVGNGYWGRQHGDDEGIPNDNNLRTTFGVYPAGGAFDTGVGNVSSVNTQNLGGAGIFPILLSSYTDFLLAEAALTIPGVNGNPKTYLEAGIRDSFTKVADFGGVAMDAAQINTYVNDVITRYDNAADDSARLNIIVKEFYIASFGNSIEAYNAYRRTGFPNDLGGSPIPQTDFPRNFLIPDSELNSNDNPDLQQITRTTQVFWDTNPAGFIQ